jgi:hypothetical protein
VTAIGEEAFHYCGSLTSVTIPDSVVEIGERAFYHCTRLTSLTIGNGVTTIGASAFDTCSNLISCTIGSRVESIGAMAFEGCLSLFLVENKSALPLSIGSEEHGGIVRHAKILIHPSGERTQRDDAAYTLTQDGFLYQTKDGTPTLLAYTGSEESITLPIAIEGKAYIIRNFRTAATHITIPDGTTRIGDEAFSGCSILKSIHIPQGVRGIGEKAFYRCSGLESLILPDSLFYINAQAFYHCTGLTDIYYAGTKEQWKMFKKIYNGKATMHYNYVETP